MLYSIESAQFTGAIFPSGSLTAISVAIQHDYIHLIVLSEWTCIWVMYFIKAYCCVQNLAFGLRSIHTAWQHADTCGVCVYVEFVCLVDG